MHTLRHTDTHMGMLKFTCILTYALTFKFAYSTFTQQTHVDTDAHMGIKFTQIHTQTHM